MHQNRQKQDRHNRNKERSQSLKGWRNFRHISEGTRVKGGPENANVKSGAVMIASKGKVNILPVAIAWKLQTVC